MWTTADLITFMWMTVELTACIAMVTPLTAGDTVKASALTANMTSI